MSRAPIDRGWAWMVCLGTGVQAFFVIGGLKCMGILFVEIIEIFDAPHSVTAMTLGLVAGGFAVFAMMCNALSVMVGMRTVTVCGGACFALSLFLSMFPINIWYIVIMLGLVAGMSLGAMLTPAVLVLSLYFDKWRSLSNGIALAGSSIGQLVLPYLMTYLIREFGYQGTMLIYSAIALHTVPAAMLLRPISFWDRKRRHSPCEMKSRKKNSNNPSSHPISKSNVMRSPLHTSQDQSFSNYDPLGPQPSVLHSAALSLVPGASVESLDVIHKQTEIQGETKKDSWKICCIHIKRITPRAFCALIFDKELIGSPCLWLLFFALGFGHAGFITSLLYMPSLAVELFNDKTKGALLMTIVGVFDLCGRVGGGWFSDQGLLSRVTIIFIGFSASGLSTILMAIHPILPVLLVYCVIMGLLGGLYRILLPVIVGDLFGRHKTGAGVGMLFMALGLLIVPVPPLLGYIRQTFGTYLPSIQFCGGLMMFGALLIGILQFVKKYDKAVVKSQLTVASDVDIQGHGSDKESIKLHQEQKNNQDDKKVENVLEKHSDSSEHV